MNVIALPLRKNQPSAQSVEAWAEVITQAWRETVGGILGVGNLLAQAQADLTNKDRPGYEPGAWGRLIGANRHKSLLPDARF
jgi:hypothetical protein